jgi:hypothetical protein
MYTRKEEDIRRAKKAIYGPYWKGYYFDKETKRYIYVNKKSPTKWCKKISNKKVRQKCEDIANGKKYKKYFDIPWTVS